MASALRYRAEYLADKDRRPGQGQGSLKVEYHRSYPGYLTHGHGSDTSLCLEGSTEAPRISRCAILHSELAQAVRGSRDMD